MFERGGAELAQNTQGHGGCKEPFQQARVIADVKQVFHMQRNSRGQVVLSRGIGALNVKGRLGLTGRP